MYAVFLPPAYSATNLLPTKHSLSTRLKSELGLTTIHVLMIPKEYEGTYEVHVA